jgi:acid phosphatase type 7
MKLWAGLLFALELVSGAVEQIALNYDSSASKMVVTFAVPGTTITQAECRYGVDPNNLINTALATGVTYTLKGTTSPMLFKATMTDLTPGNNIYYYSVGSEALGYSEVFSFKSHPGNVPNVTFFLIGDLGQTTNSETTLKELIEAESMLQTPSAGIVNAGDLSYANGRDSLWDTFGNMRQVAASRLPMMTTLGNHEWFDDVQFSFTAYLNRFDNPLVNGKRELYYSYNAGLVHWVMVAGYCPEMKLTSTQPCLAAGSPQLAWLEEDLASVDRESTPWVVVVFHEPYVNSNTAHSMKSEGPSLSVSLSLSSSSPHPSCLRFSNARGDRGHSVQVQGRSRLLRTCPRL